MGWSDGSRANDKIECVWICWSLPFAAGSLDVGDCDVQDLAEAPDDLLLTGAELPKLLVESICPKMRPGLCRDQLGVHSQHVAQLPHAAFQCIAHAKVLAERAHVHRLTLIGICRLTRDDEHPRHTGQIGRQVFGNGIGQIILGPIAAQILEGQHDDRKPG